MITLAQETDESLLARLRSGERQAFAILTQRHTEKFFALAWRTLVHKADAEDVTQDAFLKLWGAPDMFDPQRGVKFTTWFYRIVINMCHDRNRRARFQTAPDILEYMADSAPLADDNIEARDRVVAVERALMSLPERQRTALNLCFYENMSNAEAAAIMNVGVKALESLLMRAKAQMKRALANDGWTKETEVRHARTGS